MARYSASSGSSATAAAGTATLPIFGIYAGATVEPVVREFGIFNVGTVAARIRLVRVTTAGTWTALTENEFNETSVPPTAAAVHTASGTAPTIQTGDILTGGIGDAAGSGVIWTFYGENNGLVIPAGTGNGIAIIETADTANTYDCYVIWDE
jgi:hypothetical protein